MPSKNKPKRFDRNRKSQVARRKMKQRRLLAGKKRNRAPRPKKKGQVITPQVGETKKEVITKEKKNEKVMTKEKKSEPVVDSDATISEEGDE